MFYVTVDGKVITGLVFRKLQPAKETVDRLRNIYGYNAAWTRKAPRAEAR